MNFKIQSDSKQIVDYLIADGAVFVVGEPKQSIYRFRGVRSGSVYSGSGRIVETGKNIFLRYNFASTRNSGVTNAFFQPAADDPISYEDSALHRERMNRPVSTSSRPRSRYELRTSRELSWQIA